MTYDTAIGFYESDRKIAEVLGISKQAVGRWKKSGVVPAVSALKLQTNSRGKVKVDPNVYVKRPGAPFENYFGGIALPRHAGGNGASARRRRT